MKLPSRIRRKTILLLAGLPVLAAGAFVLALFLASRPMLLDGMSFSTAYYDRNSVLLRLSLAKDDKYRLFTPLKNISSDLIAATMMQEDRHFYRHFGVNPFSMLRGAFATYVLRTRPIGGSTITMQVVRMRDHLDTRSVTGKITQMFEAMRLEKFYSKDEILEAYLNLAPYGGNIHGVGAASLIYFRQPPENLALPQSLALAVVPQNPVKRSPLNADTQALQQARVRLFERMPDFSPHDGRLALPVVASSRDDLPFLAPHFVNGLSQAGGKVATTLDMSLQQMVEQRVAAWIARKKSQDIDNAAVMLIHAPTMEARVLVGSGDFSSSTTDGQVDGTMARRSPGSALKPFVYALALEQGLIHPESLLLDDPTYFAEYRPGNFDDRFIGKITAREALTLSRNVPAITLAAQLQSPNLYEFLQDAGAEFPEEQGHYGLSVVVGGAEIDMRTMARLYAMLLNGGILQDLKYVKDQQTQPARKILSPEAALLTLFMLERENPDTLPFNNTAGGLPVYWKTGTSNGFRDAWTVGVFGSYVLAVWTGHFDGRPSPALVGGETAAPLFFELVDAIGGRELTKDILKSAMKDLNLARIEVCGKTGTIKTCGDDHSTWFIPGRSPIELTGAFLREKPEILSPRDGIKYVMSRKSVEPLRISLEAKDNSGSKTAYWFADNRLIGSAESAAPVFWQPTVGSHMIRYINGQGLSAAQKITVIASD